MASNGTTSSNYWKKYAEGIGFFLKYIYGALLGICCLGSIALVCILFLKRGRNILPITMTLGFGFLLTTDSLYLFFKLFENTFYDIHNNSVNDVSPAACYSLHYIYATFSALPGYAQSVISIERVLAIAVPLKVKQIVTRNRVIGVLVLVTLIVCVIHIFYVAFGYEYFTGEVVQNQGCTPTTSILLPLLDLVVYCSVPSLIQAVSTGLIIGFLMQRQKQRLTATNNSSQRKEIRLGVTLVIMDTIFIFTTLPLSIYKLVEYTHPFNSSNDYWNFWGHFVALCTRLGPMTDWIVLICMGSQIRRVIAEPLRCRLYQKTITKSESTQTSMITRAR